MDNNKFESSIVEKSFNDWRWMKILSEIRDVTSDGAIRDSFQLWDLQFCEDGFILWFILLKQLSGLHFIINLVALRNRHNLWIDVISYIKCIVLLLFQ
jgi:hypothetical protein